LAAVAHGHQPVTGPGNGDEEGFRGEGGGLGGLGGGESEGEDEEQTDPMGEGLYAPTRRWLVQRAGA